MPRRRRPPPPALDSTTTFNLVSLATTQTPNFKHSRLLIKMSAPIVGFICALVLAALVLLWITFCMFCRERHKSENYQYDISDLRHMNYQLAQEQEVKETPPDKEAKVGIFFLPSRHKQKDEYEKRPDYPESPAPNLQPGANQLVEIFNDSVADADVHYKDGIYEIDSASQYHSDV